MDSGVTVEINGLAELDVKLKRLPADIAKRVFGKALKKAGDLIKTEVVARAPIKTEESGPKSNSLPTGALKAGIKSRISLTPEQGSGSVTVKPSKAVAHVARWIELGWTLKGHKPKKKSIRTIPARPFMRPAFDATAQAAIDTFAETLASGLEAVGDLP